jgi:hypothetical protein
LAANISPSAPAFDPQTELGTPLLAALSGLVLGGAFLGGRKLAKKRREKKAEYEDLTPFARGFFSACVDRNLDPVAAVEKVAADCPEEAMQELRDGLEKMAFGSRAVAFGKGVLNWGSRRLGLGGRAPAAPVVPPAAPIESGWRNMGGLMNPVASAAPAVAPVATSGAGRAAWNLARPTLGGAFTGGIAGDEMGFGGDSLELGPVKLNYRGMAAGATSANPFARRMAKNNLGGVLTTPMAGMRAAGVGGVGGSTIDMLADSAGYDTQGMFGRAGSWGGFGLGAGANLLAGGARLTNTNTWLGRQMLGAAKTTNDLKKGVMNFGNASGGALVAPFTYAARFATGMPMKGFFGDPAKRTSEILARRIVGTGYGLGALGTGYSALAGKVQKDATNAVNSYLEEAVPVLRDAGASMADQFFMSRGMMDQTGQFNPLMAIQNQGGIAGSIMRGADPIFQSLGLDPNRLSPIQKLMILGGGLAGAGGLIAGRPGIAATGGLAATTALAPYFLNPGVGDPTKNIPRPGVPQANNKQRLADPAGVASQPNQVPARDEWQHMQRLQQMI